MRNQSFANRDVGDKYLTFHSLDTRNLLSTEVRYNYPVQSSTGLGGLQCWPISMESLGSEMQIFVMAGLTMGFEITDKYGSGSNVLGLINL